MHARLERDEDEDGNGNDGNRTQYGKFKMIFYACETYKKWPVLFRFNAVCQIKCKCFFLRKNRLDFLF